MRLSRRSMQFAQSQIRAMTSECDRLGGINMAQGVCDLPVPREVIEGAKVAMDAGANIYTPAEGLPQLREAIAQKMQRFYSLHVDAMRELLVSDGATGAFYTACLALLNPGDEVIMFEPYYGYHRATLESVGAEVCYVKLDAPEWALDIRAMEAAVTSRTRALLICNPANPSGKVFSREELALVGSFAQKHDLVVFSDEMYEHFVYEGARHVPAMSVPSLKERTVTVSGFSKVFSITGWRLGYAIARPEVIAAMAQFNDLVYVCAPSPLQLGAAEGLARLDDAYYAELAESHRIKRDLFCGALSDAGLSPVIPEGAYYVMTDISHIQGDDDREKVMHILEKTGVAAVPGGAFYHDGSGCDTARFCYSKPLDVLEDAVKRIKTLAE